MLGRFALRCRAAASPARRFAASSEQRATLLATQDEVNTRLAARRVMRLMASFARQRTLRPLTRTLRDFADRSSRFRASTLHGAVEHRLSWAFGRVRPALDDFLRREGFDADDALLEHVATAPWAESFRGDAARPPEAFDPRCPRPPAAEELSALTLGFAACLPPRRTAEASPMRARRRRSKRRRDAAAADGGARPPRFPKAAARAALAPVVEAVGGGSAAAAVAAAAGPPAAAEAAVERAAGELGCGVAAVLEAVADAERVAALAAATCPPIARQKLEAALARERGGAAQCVAALGVHAALGAGDLLLELWRERPAPVDAEAAAERVDDLAAAEAALRAAAEDWASLEAAGVDALVKLRPHFLQADARRRGLRSLARSAGGAFDEAPGDEAPAAPAKDDDDDASWVGRKNRRAADMPGSIVQLAVAEARGSRLARDDPDARLALRRTVFLDNLPPDASERELAGMLARAGTVARVELFGAAPEDAEFGDGARRRKKKPGERAPYRLRLSVAHRSPTCALVTFDAQSGADAALDQALRVFGVVVRKRACRTRPASDVRSIYIHRLPPNVSERELLDDLGAVLAPDLQLRLWRTDPLDPPDRARLRFKSHDLARLAWRRLEDESPFADNLSWTPTAPLRAAKAASR